jgi:CysZ protein
VARIIRAMLKAFRSLMHPRMLWLMVWPVIVALVIWVTLAVFYWSEAAAWVQTHLQQYAAYQWTISVWPLKLVAAWIGWFLLLLLFVPLVLMTAVLIIGIFSMPVMVSHVSTRDYALLEKRKGGSFWGSVWNGLSALLMLLLIGIVTLPLWFVPLLWPVLPLLLFGYFNERVFRYDALAEHASPAEIADTIRRSRGELFLLGVALALIGHIPILGLFMPVYGGLAFIHYCLDRLAQLRGQDIAGALVRG